MNYIYDGSFEGLLCTLFDAYKIIDTVNIVKKSNQVNFFEDEAVVISDTCVSNRVKKSIIQKFSYRFFIEIYICYLSDTVNKENIIARTVKGVYKNGINFLNSANENVVEFNKIIKSVYREIHRYQGLLRFREVQEEFLFAEFEPKNDILEILSVHFKKRMPNEKFMIHDVLRKKCVISDKGNLNTFYVTDLKISDTEREKFFREAWKLFYKSVCIEERKNKKLMQSNMPKKYWKYLCEKAN
ncbi:TIGR03915 family putative DNA repair protein [Peptoniphilus sp. oral taxon 386]|uniref:TIGR03915 family putative DNA repair protein n=1 Tax=Peptoniphilus sp. oral taxon 386 TaxID=652713 RepID=UPI00031C6041|nr:TIGR03915 family putative DNA repair protein [Peptoniphilus sp. oral taxon 386]